MFNDSLKLFFLNRSTLNAYTVAFKTKFGGFLNFGDTAVNVFDIRKSGFFLLTPSP